LTISPLSWGTPKDISLFASLVKEHWDSRIPSP
jgi:hypothetical protein